MNRKRGILLCVCSALLLTAGCAGMESRLALDYGTSFQLQKFSQTLNAERGNDTAPVTGLNGQVAQHNAEKYRKGFEKPAPTATAYQINVGSMK